jgi:hypothetical protein
VPFPAWADTAGTIARARQLEIHIEFERFIIASFAFAWRSTALSPAPFRLDKRMVSRMSHTE